ncbi:primosomal protein N', partial [Streptococcus anginosus]|nr:primosomal protein N' [Streptococcus anginosus]
MVTEKARAPRFARVIVDVPTMQTDHPYDYYIPDRYQDLIQVGMRVQVPFGVRQVLAYVVELTTTSEFEGELKEITSLLDDQAVLTSEMLSLGRDMAEHLFSYVVT